MKKRQFAGLKLDIQRAQSFVDEELSEIEGRNEAFQGNAKNRTFDIALTQTPLEVIRDLKVTNADSLNDITQVDANLYLSSNATYLPNETINISLQTTRLLKTQKF